MVASTVWEHQLPSGLLRAAGMVVEVERVPAGLAVRTATATLPDAVRAVPVSPRMPKLVVAGGLPAGAVADVVRGLPRDLRDDLLLLFCGSPTVTWLRELTQLVGPVVFAPGLHVTTPDGGLRTVVTDDGGNEVFGPFATLLRQGPDAAQPDVLDVAPAPPGWEQHAARCYRPVDRTGVVAEVVPGGLHVRPDAGTAANVPFDPTRWTLAVGRPGREISAAESAAACELLNVLTSEQRRTARVRVLGTTSKTVLDGLDACAREAGSTLEAPLRAVPPVVTVSGPGPRRSPTPRPQIAARLDPVVPPVEPVAPVAVSIALDDRFSTEDERTRLSASAGTRYTEALATVNVALSAWPMLRPEAKADYIAVCLYLGRDKGGAVSLNEALRAGEPEPYDGYLPCLVSGLRRLPTHRRVVLVQQKPDAGPCAEGAVLTEPTFLSASTELDVTTPDAGADVLIWPMSARRTGELVAGRPVDEAVFVAGRRFKALSVRDGDRPAVLARELLPDEDPVSAEAVARDQAALPKLERAWQTRRSARLRLVEDADVVTRLTPTFATLTAAAPAGVPLGAAS